MKSFQVSENYGTELLQKKYYFLLVTVYVSVFKVLCVIKYQIFANFPPLFSAQPCIWVYVSESVSENNNNNNTDISLGQLLRLCQQYFVWVLIYAQKKYFLQEKVRDVNPANLFDVEINSSLTVWRIWVGLFTFFTYITKTHLFVFKNVLT